MKAGGVNSVTRKTLFEQLNKIHEFNAEGMFGTIDLAGRKTSPCHVLMQVKNGDFKRVFPRQGRDVRLRQEERGRGQARRLLTCRWHDADVRRLPRGVAPGARTDRA